MAISIGHLGVQPALCDLYLILDIQIKGLRRQVKMSAFNTYWAQWVEIDKWFVEHSDLKPYFYHGKDIHPSDETVDYTTRDRIDSAAEMLLDSFANMYFQRDSIETDEERRVFRDFMRKVYREQPYFRRFVDEHIDWYSPGFGNFIRGES